MNHESIPLGIRLTAVVSLVGLAGLGYQVWQGMPGPDPWAGTYRAEAHPALLIEPPPPPAVASEEPVESLPVAANWHEQRLTGTDENDRSVFFRVMLLSPNYRWLPASTTEILEGKQVRSLADLPDRGELSGQLASSRAVLVLGTDEETRDGSLLSTERARNLSQWLRRSLGSGTTVIPVDAGRYRGATAPPEDQVGRLIVAAVSVLDPGADLAAALRNALAENEESPLNVRLYSRFEPVTAEGDTASR